MKSQSRKTQGGFINGMLVIGIALLAVVVGAIAMAGSSSTTDVAKQKTRTTTAVGMKKFSDAVEAFQINVAEVGVTAAEAGFVLPQMPKGFQSTVSAAAYTTPTLVVSDVDADVCAEINRVLGNETQPADAAAITATGVREGCTAENDYIRVVKG